MGGQEERKFAPVARAAVQDLGGSRIREVANASMGRKDVLKFWFGESDQPTPEFIRAAAIGSLASEHTFYTQNLGLPELREAIAHYSGQLHDTPLDASRIAVTASGVSAIMLAAQTILSPGDRVVVVTPVWPNVVEIQHVMGARVERVPLSISGGRWALDLDRLLAALTPDTVMLVVNSPNNPTGWTMPAEQQVRVMEHCRRLGIWVLSDEVYERLVYSGEPAAPSLRCLCAEDDRLIVVNSFSKSWRMTGWRLGWLTLPPALVGQLEKLIEYNTSCTPEFVQRGALAALTSPRGEQVVADAVAALKRSRATLHEGLSLLDGIVAPLGEGAMYAFFRPLAGTDSVLLAKRLVVEEGLGLAPGVAFGPEGEGWLRWCYAATPERITEGISRLARFLGSSQR